MATFAAHGWSIRLALASSPKVPFPLICPDSQAIKANPVKVLAILVSLVLPGAGSMIMGQVRVGIAQIVLFAVAVFVSFPLFLAIIGVPVMLVVWIWGLLTVISTPR